MSISFHNQSDRLRTFIHDLSLAKAKFKHQTGVLQKRRFHRRRVLFDIVTDSGEATAILQSNLTCTIQIADGLYKVNTKTCDISFIKFMNKAYNGEPVVNIFKLDSSPNIRIACNNLKTVFLNGVKSRIVLEKDSGREFCEFPIM